MHRVLDFLRRQAVDAPDAPDGQLLRRFADARDEAAFAELVRRHGPVVFGVCRRLLADPPEGTLSAWLSRALARLRARLGAEAPLAVAGSTAVSADLAAATARAAAVYSLSFRPAAGVSPAAAGLAQGVLRMYRIRAAALAAGMALAVGGLTALGVAAGAGEPAAAANDPPPARASNPKPAAPEGDDDLKDLVPTYIEGTVRDGDGKPIAGARVEKNGTTGYVVTTGEPEFRGHAVTGPDGRYRLGFKTKPGRTTTITAISARADGYVSHVERFQYDELKTSPGKPGRWDFVLARGEVIAGRVAEADPGDHIPILVRSPSFTQQTTTRPDGTFRLWVPKGVYTVTAAVHIKSVVRDEKLSPEYRNGLIIKRAATAEKVPSGTEGLVLKTP
jgi:hypothetical protein